MSSRATAESVPLRGIMAISVYVNQEIVEALGLLPPPPLKGYLPPIRWERESEYQVLNIEFGGTLRVCFAKAGRGFIARNTRLPIKFVRPLKQVPVD